MLADLLDFGKNRTLKQSVGLFLCYAVVFFVLFIVISAVGGIIS